MNRLDSEYVYLNTIKHINWHISMKSILKMYDNLKIHNKNSYVDYKNIIKKLVKKEEVKMFNIDEYLTSLKLNSKKTSYSDNEKYKTYIHLLAKTCVRFVKNNMKGA